MFASFPALYSYLFHSYIYGPKYKKPLGIRSKLVCYNMSLIRKCEIKVSYISVSYSREFTVPQDIKMKLKRHTRRCLKSHSETFMFQETTERKTNLRKYTEGDAKDNQLIIDENT